MKQQNRFKRILAFLLICVLSITFVTTEWQPFPQTMGQALANTSSVRVNVSVLNVRSGPGLQYEIIGKIRDGEIYPVIAQKEKWYKIKLKNGTFGWVANWLVTADVSTVKSIQSKVDSLNVRSGPSQSFSVIDQIHSNKLYPLLEEQGNWIKIKLSDNRTGWVAEWLVDKQSSSPEELSSNNEDMATVSVSILNVRSGPGTEYEQLGQLKKGETLKVIGVKNGWYQILYQGAEAWIAGEFASLHSQPDNEQAPSGSTRKVTVTTDTLNLRSGPSIESTVTGRLQQGAILTVIEEKEDWLNVKTPEGETGWVAEWLVAEKGDGDVINNPPKVTILYPGTNIRSGPGTSYGIVSRANVNDQFSVVETDGNWFKIKLNNGQTAYVAGWIVATEGIPGVEQASTGKFLSGKTIVVDPGHGGIDDGATGPFLNTVEKKVNMQVSNILASKLKEAGANVVMTRTDDRKIPLQTRVDIAINHQADAFISIHHNTHDDSRINGTITYFYSNGNDRTLARLIQNELIKRNGRNDLKARRGNYFVLRENPRLAVLVELGFLTNYAEELIINTKEFQENAAEGIFQGILLYFKQR